MHSLFRRRERSGGLTLRRFALLPVTALILVLTGLPSGANDRDDPTPIPPSRTENPPLKVACGLDFVLVLDRSTSVRGSAAQNAVRNAANAFLVDLADTGSNVSLVSFSDNASLDMAPIALTSGANLDALQQAVTDTVFGGYTNWDHPLEVTRDQFGTAPFAGAAPTSS